MRDGYVDQLLAFGKHSLLDNPINYCKWTTFPKTYSMFFEIVPQLVYIVTDVVNATSMYQLGTTFSGFLIHVDHLYWEWITYYFPPMKTQILYTQILFPTLPVPNISFSLEPLYNFAGTESIPKFHRKI